MNSHENLERKFRLDYIQEKLESLLPWQLIEFEKTITTAAEAATNPSKCRSCGASIIWGKTAAGKACPFDLATGESHFKTCPQAVEWSKTSKLKRTASLNGTPEIFSQSPESKVKHSESAAIMGLCECWECNQQQQQPQRGEK